MGIFDRIINVKGRVAVIDEATSTVTLKLDPWPDGLDSEYENKAAILALLDSDVGDVLDITNLLGDLSSDTE